MTSKLTRSTIKGLLGSLFILTCLNQASAENKKPNLLIIMTDDQGQWSLGEYDERVETPNLDHLARHGVVFNQAISPTPVCSAARASLYTGRTASQHGVHDFLSDKDASSNEWLKGETLISEILADAGYQVGLFGKWHATTKGWEPARGFHEWVTYDEREVGWINQYQHSGTVHFVRNGQKFLHTGVQARFLSEEVVRFIDASADTRFAAFLNFVEPHFPFAGLPERLVSRYRPLARDIVAAGDYSATASSARYPDNVLDHDEKLAQYLAAVSLVDEQLGRLLDALMGRGILDNTLIVFTSDHGHLTGQYGLYGKGNASVPQNFYEASIKIPLIIYGPAGIVAPGQVRNDFVNLYDLFPTLVDLVGARPAMLAYDGPGKSLLPLLAGQRVSTFREFQYAEMGNGRMIHNGRWKLVRYYQRDAELAPIDLWFDLAHPLGERTSVPPPSSSQQLQLESALQQFFATYETHKHSGRRIWALPKHNAMEIWRRQ